MYEIILLDYSMPDIDGPVVATNIREMLSDCMLISADQTPFICCCTAYDERKFKKKALSAGMNQFL